MATVTVNTQEYERSHGKKPRGFGLWMFRLTDWSLAGDDVVRITDTYTNAKDYAVRAARMKDLDVVTVLP